jgi:hypothetical protein
MQRSGNALSRFQACGHTKHYSRDRCDQEKFLTTKWQQDGRLIWADLRVGGQDTINYATDDMKHTIGDETLALKYVQET